MARGELAIPGISSVQAALGILMLVAAGSLGVFPCYYSFTQELSKEHIGLVTGLLSFVAWVVPSGLQKPLGAHIDKTGSYDLAFQVGAWPMIIAAVLLWMFSDLDWLTWRRAQRDRGAYAPIFCRAASFPHSRCPAWECQAASSRSDLLSTPFRTGAKLLSILPLQGSNQGGR